MEMCIHVNITIYRRYQPVTAIGLQKVRGAARLIVGGELGVWLRVGLCLLLLLMNGFTLEW